MIAALPMYDQPQTAAAHDRYWALIRDNLRDDGFDVPDRLTRDRDPWGGWVAPDLLLSQTCGLPYRAALAPEVTLVGTPCHGHDGCAPGFYNSAIIVRVDDPRQSSDAFEGATFAYNDPLSQSGWAALWSWACARQITLGVGFQTGNHLASALAVSSGKADLAAIDAQSWRLIQRWDDPGNLRVLAETTPTPGLPYITAKNRDPAPLRNAIRAAIGALSLEDRDVLDLHSLEAIPTEEYLAQPLPPAP